ncbi:uncharacterized protein Z520_00744 [Fonsecaea multimorphosa CBS 102226]|uniref:Uncharacterized protein n=1 Tax=Fonsecaea multimorphosa CBS 102226 TaxID=1442371 RepID=A0A0D2J3T6_9EURO|nr:uncharacterized protein Z520_00744 [Fonsecaea multimorphosa CBS 102226]KIY04052.1 hypothetical protein Z520_00744 [Fonsecaea multimorphosa CBS 102226]
MSEKVKMIISGDPACTVRPPRPRPSDPSPTIDIDDSTGDDGRTVEPIRPDTPPPQPQGGAR